MVPFTLNMIYRASSGTVSASRPNSKKIRERVTFIGRFSRSRVAQVVPPLKRVDSEEMKGIETFPFTMLLLIQGKFPSMKASHRVPLLISSRDRSQQGFF